MKIKIKKKLKYPPEEKKRLWARHLAKERALLRKRRLKLGLSDFHTLIKVGEGAYGEVFCFIE